MKVLKVSSYPLRACFALALLAGCASPSDRTMPNNGSQDRLTVEHLRHAGSWMHPTTSGDLIYVSVYKGVEIYSTVGKAVGMLQGLTDPGMCSDTQGNIWVTYGDSMLQYPHGGTYPIAQAYLPSSFQARSCAVDPTTGNLAVVEVSESNGQNIAVFQNIYDPPQTYTDPEFSESYFCLAYDNQGNLFVNGTGKKAKLLAELPAGGNTLGTVTVDQNLGKIGGLQWDGQYLAVGDSLNHVVYQMSVASGKAVTEGATHYNGQRPQFKVVVPFAIQNGLLVIQVAANKIGYFNYPSGGKPTHRLSVISNGNVAISVAASRAIGRRE